MRIGKSALWFVLSAAWLAARPAAAGQLVLTPVPASLPAGATGQLQISVQLDTAPFGGYLFTLSYDTRALTLLSIGGAASGEFHDEFFQGPGSAAGSFTFQGLNDASLLSPTGGANLAVAVFQATSSSGPFAGAAAFSSPVAVTVRESVATSGSTVTVLGASSAFQVLGDTVAPATSLTALGPQSSGAGALFVATSTALGFSAVDSAAGTFPPSGVASTLYRVDPSTPSAPFQTFASAFSLPIGVHRIEFRSLDLAGNREAIRVGTVAVDGLPPRSSLSAGAPSFSSATLYASDVTTFSIAAVDDLAAAGDGAGAGVARSFVAVDTTVFSVSPGTFSLAGEGPHSIRFYSVDLFSNAETAQGAQVAVDLTPPVTQLQILGSSTTDARGLPTIATTTLISLSAVDPVSNGVASGVDIIFYAVDVDPFACGGAPPDPAQPPGTCGNQTYNGPFSLPAGTHTIFYLSEDEVGNQEALNAVTIDSQIDTTPPAIAAAVSPAPSAGGWVAVIPATVTFNCSFGSTGGRCPPPVYLTAQSSGTLVAGTATGNNGLSASTSVVVRIETAAPSIAVSSPAAGSYIAHRDTITISFAVADAFDASPFSTGTLVQLSTAAGAPGKLSGSVVVTGGQTFDPLQLSAGVWQLQVAASNHAGNVSSARGAAFTVIHDIQPPRTAIAVGAPKSGSFVSPATPFALSAVDDLVAPGDGLGLGVARTLYSIDAGTAAAYASPFVVAAPGPRTIHFHSVDLLGNAEADQTLSVTVDTAPPAFSTPQVAANGGAFAPASAILNAVSNDAAQVSVFDALSGVATAPIAAQPVALPGTVGLWRFDESSGTTAGDSSGLGNNGVLQGSPAWGPGRFGSALAFGPNSYAAIPNAKNVPTGMHPYTMSAWFNVAVYQRGPSNNGEGIIGYGDWGGGNAVNALRLAPDVCGPTTLGFRHYWWGNDLDFCTNLNQLSQFVGSWHHVAVTFDGTTRGLYFDGRLMKSDAPLGHAVANVSNLQIGNTNGNEWFYGSLDEVRLSGAAMSAADIAREAGLGPPYAAKVTTDGGATWAAVSQASVTLALAGTAPSGPYALSAAGLGLVNSTAAATNQVLFSAADNVGNAATFSMNVLVDAIPPQTTASVSGTQGNNGWYVSPASVSLSAADNFSGVAQTFYALDGGAARVYGSTLSLASGVHALSFYSVDKARNQEAANSLTVKVDTVAPTIAVAVSPSPNAAGWTNVLPTTVTFSCTQGISGGACPAPASLAQETAATTISGTITDNNGLSASTAVVVKIDITPPRTALAILGGRQFPGSDAAAFYASSDTRLSLPAMDPLSNGTASGLALTRYQDNGAAFQTFVSAFGLSEGTHRLAYQSQDNADNLEVLRSTTVLVDATPPVTTLAIIGGRQFPGPDAATFYASSDTRLALPAFDPVVGGVASGVAFTRWHDNGGPFGLYGSSFALAEGAHALGYQSQDNVANLEVSRSANAWIDATPPATSFAIGTPYYQAPDGANYIAPATPVTFSAADPALPSGQPGSGVDHIEVAIDGGPFTVYTASLTFAEGRHAILYRSIDHVANVEAAKTLYLRSDATPPAGSLAIGRPRYQLPAVLLVSSRTPFAVAAIDPVVNNVASGVKDSWYGVADLSPSTAPFRQFAASFTLSGLDVDKVIGFYSRDNVLNAEVVKSSTVLLDSTPPELALLSPPACDAGVCRVLKGKFPVLGTAKDLHFRDYQLESAPGQNAGSGFVLIASGTVNISSGALGAWDASKLSGWRTVRLTATDLVENVSVLAINVFVGDPGELLTLGDHETFDMPEGVAVSSSGAIYAADRNNDRIAIFSSTGTLLASFGRRRGHEDEDEHRLSTATVRLNKPSGVAVDASGAIFVADTNDNRVLKLSAAGQILLELGRSRRGEEGGRQGRRPGEFNKPSGVALDGAGSIYVSDTENRRVQVFTSTGGFAFQFQLPPVPERKERQGKDEERRELGKPAGIAVDPAGRIYVADPQGHRALEFDPAGKLLLALPIEGREDGQDEGGLVPGQPEGVAVSPSGECLLVSDRKLSRVLKFDFQGHRTLVFGGKGKLKDDGNEPKAPGIVFNKPMGLALDAQGHLFVADRNNDRIRKFGLPTGQPALIVPPAKPEDDRVARDVLDKDDGGKVARKDKASVDIPAHALADDLKITVSPPALISAADEGRKQKALKDKDLKAVSVPVEFGPEGTAFELPVTLTLPFDPELVAARKVSEDDLKVHFWNRDKARWEDLPSVVDKKTHTVSAKTRHFSLYQVLSGASTAEAARAVADPAFRLGQVYAFPNPAKRSNPTIHVEAGLADSLDIHIYDISGDLVKSAAVGGPPQVINDGSGRGPQYAYEWTWDVSGTGSGIYVYVVTAHQGEETLKATKKVAVLK